MGVYLNGARRRLNAAPVVAAGEAGRQVGDAVGAAHGADGGGEAVALTDALGLWNQASSQGPAHTDGETESLSVERHIQQQQQQGARK